MEICENVEMWSEGIMELAMENTMVQRVDEYTRYRGTEEPALLDLIFTRRPEGRPEIEYLSPMGKSNHVVI